MRLADASVLIGTASCSIQSLSSTQIKCTLGNNPAGNYPVIVQINPIGYSNADITFTYQLLVNSLSSIEGSSAGGLNLVISGSGFSSQTQVTICNNVCKTVQSSYSSLTCTVRIKFILRKSFFI